MNKSIPFLLVIFLSLSTVLAEAPAQPTTAPSFTRQQDVVYGRSYGAALTFDIFRPTGKPNGAGVIFVVSGGWVSTPELLGTPIFAAFANPLTSRGYTVFGVCHACQPKFQIPEIVGNINRSVRFIRMHAAEYGIDPNRIGITGASAGGHLSLMQGFSPEPEKTDSPDPLLRVSSRVQAVACFFPPSDFLNYGKEGENAMGCGVLADFYGAFDFRELDPKTHTLERITDIGKLIQIGHDISPVYHIDAKSPPTLILHGDADHLVPIQQSELVMDKLQALNIPHELYVKKGGQHGWPDIGTDMVRVVDWFDKYLAKSKD